MTVRRSVWSLHPYAIRCASAVVCLMNPPETAVVFICLRNVCWIRNLVSCIAVIMDRDLQWNFLCFFLFFFTLQSSPSPFACEALAEATPPINRPRPVPISSTLNTPLSLLSLQACALHTSAATFYQVPAWCGFSVWFLTDVRFAVVCSYPLIKSCCRLNQQGEKHLMNEQVE